MEGLEDRAVVVELGERSIQRGEEAIVDAGVTDVVANCGDEQRQGVKGSEERGDW